MSFELARNSAIHYLESKGIEDFEIHTESHTEGTNIWNIGVTHSGTEYFFYINDEGVIVHTSITYSREEQLKKDPKKIIAVFILFLASISISHFSIGHELGFLLSILTAVYGFALTPINKSKSYEN